MAERNEGEVGLGELFVHEGLITEGQLREALAAAEASGHRLGWALVELGFVSELEVTRMLATHLRMPAVDLELVTVDPRILEMMPAGVAHKYVALPLRRVGRVLTVAMADPMNLEVIDALRFVTRLEIEPVIVGDYTLVRHIEKYYGPEGQDATLEFEELEVVEEEEEDYSALAAEVDSAPVVKFINGLLTDAVLKGVSDIHIEPYERELRVRYRIDGALQDVMRPPVKLTAALTSRIKILADLNIAERRVPQRGRIKLKMRDKIVDFRVSTLPVIFGEKIVLRILDKGSLTFDLTTFGFEPKALNDFMWAIQRPYGMVLVTGPTGSGKTTTLYSALSQINTIETNIMTAEDPVEYNIFGVNQLLVRDEIGMTFAAALDEILWQDPDVVMIGSIRDVETGERATRAALDGHLVLSAMNTEDTPSTITRLIDMGVAPVNVASALNLVLAQRLGRRICAECRVEARYDETYLTAQRIDLDWANSTTLYRGQGCDRCGGTGYEGRCGFYEVMTVTETLRRAIMNGARTDEIRELARSEGMSTLREDALRKVEQGITTLDEVFRRTTVAG